MHIKSRKPFCEDQSSKFFFFFFLEKTPIRQARASQAAEQTLVSVKSSSVITAVALLSNRGSNGRRSLRKHRPQLSVCCLANLSEVKIRGQCCLWRGGALRGVRARSTGETQLRRMRADSLTEDGQSSMAGHQPLQTSPL